MVGQDKLTDADASIQKTKALRINKISSAMCYYGSIITLTQTEKMCPIEICNMTIYNKVLSSAVNVKYLINICATLIKRCWMHKWGSLFRCITESHGYFLFTKLCHFISSHYLLLLIKMSAAVMWVITKQLYCMT